MYCCYCYCCKDAVVADVGAGGMLLRGRMRTGRFDNWLKTAMAIGMMTANVVDDNLSLFRRLDFYRGVPGD